MAAFPNVAVRNIAGFNIPQFNEVDIDYVGSTNNIDKVYYKEGSATVATLTFSYTTNPPTTNDAELATVTKS